MSWRTSPPADSYHCIQSGDNFAYIHKTAKIQTQLSIGRFSYINSGSCFGGKFPVAIGSFCSIAADVYCWTYENHQTAFVSSFPFKTVLGLPVEYSEIDETKKGVFIGHDVWIGHEVRINQGVRIGNGCVIAARAVVTKECEPYGIYAGVPAKLVRKRFSDPVIAALQELAWWDWPLEKIMCNAKFFSLKLDEIDNPEIIFSAVQPAP